MAQLSAEMIAEIRAVADAYVVAERRRIERSNRSALAQRATSRREVEAFLSHRPDRTADLADLLDGMSAFRSLATVHVMRMVEEDVLTAVPSLHGWTIPDNVTITLHAAA